MAKSNKIAIDKRALEADPVGVLEKQGIDVENLIKHTITRALGNTATAEMRDYVNAKKLDYLQSRIAELEQPPAPDDAPTAEAPAKPLSFDDIKNSVVADNNAKYADRYRAEEVQSHRAREAALKQSAGDSYAALRREVLAKHDDNYKALDEAAKAD